MVSKTGFMGVLMNGERVLEITFQKGRCDFDRTILCYEASRNHHTVFEATKVKINLVVLGVMRVTSLEMFYQFLSDKDWSLGSLKMMWHFSRLEWLRWENTLEISNRTILLRCHNYIRCGRTENRVLLFAG